MKDSPMHGKRGHSVKAPETATEKAAAKKAAAAAKKAAKE